MANPRSIHHLAGVIEEALDANSLHDVLLTLAEVLEDRVDAVANVPVGFDESSTKEPQVLRQLWYMIGSLDD